jgi:hypothetical protein
MNPRIAGSVGNAISGAADQLASVSDYGAQVAERIKKAQDEGILLGAENSIAADMEQAHAGLANWTDYTHADQMKQDTADRIRDKYSQQYGNRPDLWRYIEPYLGKELNSYNGVVDTKAAQLTVEYNKGALLNSQLRTENEAATEPTLPGKEQIWGMQDDKIDMMVKNGTIRADEGEIQKKLLRSRTISAEVERAANPLNAPSIMDDELKRLNEYEGKGYVDPKELGAMRDHLATAYERAVTKLDRVDVSKEGDGIIAGLMKDPTVKDPETGKTDYLKAAQKADENPDIGTKTKKYIREELEQRDTVQKHITNESNQKILDELAPRLYDTKNPLTSAEVKKRALLAPSEQGYIPREVESHLLTSLGQMERENRSLNIQARQEARQEAEDKSKNMAYDLLMNSGSLIDRSDLIPYMLKGLSKGDALTVWENKQLAKDDGWRSAVALINASPLYDHNTDEGRTKLATDTLNFAHTVQNKKLTGGQIVTELNNELHPKEEAQRQQQVKLSLDNVHYSWWDLLSGGSSEGAKIDFVPDSQAPARPKGVPDAAQWNKEAKQWQLPPQQ